MTGAEIAWVLSMAHSTVSGILTKIGLGKLGRLGLEPAQRYERERPRKLIHIDVKKLGRIHDGAGHRVTGKRGRYTGSRTDAAAARRPTARPSAFIRTMLDGWAYGAIYRDSTPTHRRALRLT